MNVKTLEEIDFFRIREVVADYCITTEGKNSFLQKLPISDSEQIDFLKKCGIEWTRYLNVLHATPLKYWEPIKNLLPIIRMNGASLTLEQVHALSQFCVSVRTVKENIEKHKIELELNILSAECEKLLDLSETEKKIFRIITPDGQMKDLPEIAAIRQKIAALNSKIKVIMHKYTSDSKYSGILESTVPVLRGGRQVLAVKASMQNRIPGLIYEVSASAQTVYIEPDEAVRCSNELVQKEHELEMEIKKVLTNLTTELQPSIPLFKNNLQIMLLFDTTLAGARWGKENNCTYAETCKYFVETQEFEPPILAQARHPLLKDKAVPIDIRFLPNKRVLIITGPNTGGKTVSLKTFALFSMLNQIGLPVLASYETRLPIFTNVFADIGDDQSLDNSLSTFSGHMKNIARAVQNANDTTLILLDELGSGTDPQEGTAISMAVLDTLIEKKSFVLVTTHQGILKNYGYTNPCCINASVEFNQSTLSPSYRLIMGIPGESHALDIAQKSGLPGFICKKARNYISTEQADVSSLIKGLNKKHIELDRLQSEFRKKNDVAEKEQQKLKEKELELKQKEMELKQGISREASEFLIQSRKTLENLIRSIKEGEITREKTLAAKQFISQTEKSVYEFDESVEKENESLNQEIIEFQKQKKNHPASNKKTKKRMKNSEALKNATSTFVQNSVSEKTEELSFVEGAIVQAGQSQNEGVLICQERKGVWSVQFGSIKMSMKEKDLRLVGKKTSLNPSISIDLVSENGITQKEKEHPVFELRLLGMYAQDAIKALEHQIDLCTLQNFSYFSVIHGKGNGILQQAVHDYLSHCPAVKEFTFATAEDGGTGKTYVTLK